MANSDNVKRFTTGVNLADGRRFEEGDKVPADIDKKEYKELVILGAIEE